MSKTRMSILSALAAIAFGIFGASSVSAAPANGGVSTLHPCQPYRRFGTIGAMATTARIIGIATTAPITVDPIIIDPIIMAIIDRTIITAPTTVRIIIVIIGKHDYRWL